MALCGSLCLQPLAVKLQPAPSSQSSLIVTDAAPAKLKSAMPIGQYLHKVTPDNKSY